MHHAFCSKHLANALRLHLTKEKKRNPNLKPAKFTDKQLYTLQNKSSLRKFNDAMKELKGLNPTAHNYLLKKKDPKKWSVAVMGDLKPKRVPCFSQKTSNAVEGTFGVLRNLGIRELHPYKATDAILRYTSERFGILQKQAEKWKSEKKTFTPFISEKISKETKCLTPHNLMLEQCGDMCMYICYDVGRTAYTVNIDEEKPSCQCQFFKQFVAPCRHLQAAIQRYNAKHKSSPDEQKRLSRYCHSGYLVDQHITGFSKKNLLTRPPIVSGPGVASIDDNDDAMKPPIGCTMEDFKSRRKPGRPSKVTRKRSRGSEEQKKRKRACGDCSVRL